MKKIYYYSLFRVHYHIKKALAKDKQLEFIWQQTWGEKKRNFVFFLIL